MEEFCMCGIVGYVGESQAAPILLEGLSKLEYRGYDSAGMAVYDGEKIHVNRELPEIKKYAFRKGVSFHFRN